MKKNRKIRILDLWRHIGVARIFARGALYCCLKCWRPFLVVSLLSIWNAPPPLNYTPHPPTPNKKCPSPAPRGVHISRPPGGALTTYPIDWAPNPQFFLSPWGCSCIAPLATPTNSVNSAANCPMLLNFGVYTWTYIVSRKPASWLKPTTAGGMGSLKRNYHIF